MRAGLPSYRPADAEQRSQDLFRLDRPPSAHEIEKTCAKGRGTSSPWSMQSAATRSANARTAALANSRVSPYAMTPGMDSISAHQRPSSSRPTTIGMDSTVTVSIDFYVNHRLERNRRPRRCVNALNIRRSHHTPRSDHNNRLRRICPTSHLPRGPEAFCVSHPERPYQLYSRKHPAARSGNAAPQTLCLVSSTTRKRPDQNLLRSVAPIE
jgi:hypothetical protein